MRDFRVQLPGLRHHGLYPDTELERADVRKQLERILSSPVFQNSKRYAAVLKFLIDRTLEGSGDQLKERTIGIEVFNRAPDYDTATDHAVRSAVAEVRKRLAQFYQENPLEPVRIEVLPGSYVPQFRKAERPLVPARPAVLAQQQAQSSDSCPHSSSAIAMVAPCGGLSQPFLSCPPPPPRRTFS